MTVLINPGPDLSASTFYVESDSFFDFSQPENSALPSSGFLEIETIRNAGDEIIKKASNHQATIDDSLSPSDYRRSYVGWFDPHNENYAWLVQKLSHNIAYFNALYWNFELTGFAEQYQYTVYNAEQQGHYNWHLDITNKWDSSPRKLSVVIQLSAPDEYEGGDFCIKTSEEEIILSKEKGTMIIFPSYILHKVTPVTKGVRRSLVCWISGPKFR